MKKNKLSSAPSENSSPLFGRRLTGEVDMAELSSSGGGEGSSTSSREGSAEKQNMLDQNNYETIERKTVTKRVRDPGYETIPGEKCRRDLMDSLNAAQPQLVEATGKSRNSAPAGECRK